MSRLLTTGLMCAVFASACSAPAEQALETPSDPGPALKSLHLLNLPAEVSESQLATVLADINSAIAEIGDPAAGCTLYKVQSDTTAEYEYLWEGNWPSQAAYDVIHGNETYTAAFEAHQPVFDALAEAQVYRRYVEVRSSGIQ